MNKEKICLQCKVTFSKPSYNSKKVWEKRSYCSQKCTGLAWVGHAPPKSAFKKGDNTGSKNNKWKENAGYVAIHDWVRRYKEKHKNCEDCGIGSDIRRLEWSNIDHKYRRNLDDYNALCRYCHEAHHRKMKLLAK